MITMASKHMIMDMQNKNILLAYQVTVFFWTTKDHGDQLSFASCRCQELSDKKTLRDETTAQLKAKTVVVAGWKHHDKTL